jgi:hypothetical protein
MHLPDTAVPLLHCSKKSNRGLMGGAVYCLDLYRLCVTALRFARA